MEYLNLYATPSDLDKDIKLGNVFEVPHNFTVTYPDSLDWRTKGAVGISKEPSQLRTRTCPLYLLYTINLCMLVGIYGIYISS